LNYESASGHMSWRPVKARTGWKKAISIVSAVGLAGAICAGIASAATSTITPTYAGSPPVVRDTSVTITTNPLARMFNRSTATANWAVTAPVTSGLGLGCRGDTGAIGTAGTGNNTPRTGLKVTGPGAITLLNTLSPVIDASIAGAIGGYPVVTPQPAPSATNYRGGVPAASPNNLTQTRPWVNTVNLAGQPAGIYTVVTTSQNMTKQGTGACTIATAVPGTNAAAVAGLVTETQTFEYRPWQRVFTDVFNNGGINVNITPREFQPIIAATPGFPQATGAIVNGTPKTQQFYTLPAGTFYLLPTDPAGCADDPTSCLPAAAVGGCEPSAGCKPRLMIINSNAVNPTTGVGQEIKGVFDLDTLAYVAYVRIGKQTRVQVSLGTATDAFYKNLLNQLAGQAAAQGIDLFHILATTVRVRTGTAEVKLSLLNGLQIDPKKAKAGVQIVSDYSAQAGLILNIYAALGGPVCATNVGDSSPTTAAPDRYTHLADAGYTVEKSDLLPEVPRVGPAGALVGGPIYHIEGDFVGTAPALVNTSTAVIGVDTAADEPNGYPIWVEPFLSTPAHTTVARTMDFIGTATWSASETPVTGVGCLTVDFLLGAGVAIYNNPLPIGFGDIPIWDPQSPEVQALMAQINAAVQDAVNQVTGNPTVNDLLTQITDALPPVPGVPV